MTTMMTCLVCITIFGSITMVDKLNEKLNMYLEKKFG